jgi:hypothetical protein
MLGFAIIKDMKFINDKYKKSRGGYSRLLEISCEKCSEYICRYQKDGPGNLRRMYLDRIFEAAVSVQSKTLTCTNGHTLGIKIVYDKEKRLAYRIFIDAIMKKIIKL